MSRLLALALLSVLLAVVPVVSAEPEDDPPPLRIATFDLGRVEKECRRKVEGAALIERTFATEKKAFELLEAELGQMVEDLRNSPFRRDSAEYREMVARVRERERRVKETGVALATRIQDAKSELLRSIYADLEEAVRKLAEEQGYELVFQVQRPNPELPAPDLARQLNMMALYHAHPRFDITERIVAAMNAAYAGD